MLEDSTERRFSCQKKEKNSYTVPQMVQSSWQQEIRYHRKIHLWRGTPLHEERSTTMFFKELDGSLNHQTTRMTQKPEMISGVFSGNHIYRHHIEPRVELHAPKEGSLPVPLKYI